MRSRPALKYVIGALVGAAVPAMLVSGEAWAQEKDRPHALPADHERRGLLHGAGLSPGRPRRSASGHPGHLAVFRAVSCHLRFPVPRARRPGRRAMTRQACQAWRSRLVVAASGSVPQHTSESS